MKPLIFVFALAVLCALLLVRAFGQERILPDAELTPGVIASTDQAEVCGIAGGLSYSKRHRVTPPAMKAEVRQRYSAHRCSEIDHLLPLALGGADAVENLWCQTADAPFGFREKDKLETRVWQMVCRERTMTLSAAQAIFIGQDWRVGFCKFIGNSACVGLINARPLTGEASSRP